MENRNDYGLLINPDTKLHRQWFNEMVKLHGVYTKYKAPRHGKEFDHHGELDVDTNYYPEEKVGVIFEQYPDQKSLRKMGWVAELQEGSSIIHVPYDLPHLEVGALFTIPAGIDFAEPRTFRVISMSNIMIYPASIACEIALEYKTTEEKSQLTDFTSEKYLLEETNLLCEADDWNVGAPIKHNDITTKLIEKINLKNEELQAFSEIFLNLVGIGIDINKTLNDIDAKYKPFAQKLDSLSNSLIDLAQKIEKISDETLRQNGSSLELLDGLGVILDKLVFPKKLKNIKDLENIITRLTPIIDKCLKSIEDINDTLTDSIDSESDETKTKGRDWQEAFAKAEKNGTKDAVWEEYCKAEWPNDINNLNKFKKPLIIEIKTYGSKPKDNPFIKFLYIISGKDSDSDIDKEAITVNLGSLTENGYAHIHNNFINRNISKADLTGNTPEIGYNCILFKADLYNYKGTDIDKIINFQYKLTSEKKFSKASILGALYKDYDEEKDQGPCKILRDPSGIKGRSDNLGLSTENIITNIALKNIITQLNNLNYGNLKPIEKLSVIAYALSPLAPTSRDRSTIIKALEGKYNGLHYPKGIGSELIIYIQNKIFGSYDIYTKDIFNIIDILAKEWGVNNKEAENKKEAETQ